MLPCTSARTDTLTVEEREPLSLGLAYSHSFRAMARILGQAPSTLSHEVARNATQTIRIALARCSAMRQPEPITHDASGNSSIRGCGSMSRHN